MSELINNRERRVQTLKEVILHLLPGVPRGACSRVLPKWSRDSLKPWPSPPWARR